MFSALHGSRLSSAPITIPSPSPARHDQWANQRGLHRANSIDHEISTLAAQALWSPPLRRAYTSISGALRAMRDLNLMAGNRIDQRGREGWAPPGIVRCRGQVLLEHQRGLLSNTPAAHLFVEDDPDLTMSNMLQHYAEMTHSIAARHAHSSVCELQTQAAENTFRAYRTLRESHDTPLPAYCGEQAYLLHYFLAREGLPREQMRVFFCTNDLVNPDVIEQMQMQGQWDDATSAMWPADGGNHCAVVIGPEAVVSKLDRYGQEYHYQKWLTFLRDNHDELVIVDTWANDKVLVFPDASDVDSKIPIWLRDAGVDLPHPDATRREWHFRAAADKGVVTHVDLHRLFQSSVLARGPYGTPSLHYCEEDGDSVSSFDRSFERSFDADVRHEIVIRDPVDRNDLKARVVAAPAETARQASSLPVSAARYSRTS